MLKTFEDLKGQTITNISVSYHYATMIFTLDNGERYQLYHRQDCCEGVDIEDIAGDLDDLLNMPILLAEEVSNSDDPAKSTTDDSYTWIFYKLSTNRGSVTIRWYGSSNGYYSESVDWCKLDSKGNTGYDY